MSMSFDKPLDEDQQKLLADFMGDSLTAMDEKTALFENFEMQREEMSQLANDLKQPIKVEINEDGHTKTMSDGTKYACTNRGWVKVPE